MIVDTRTGAVVSMSPEEQKILALWIMEKAAEDPDILNKI